MRKLTILILLAMVIASCTTRQETNPFLKPYDTPFGVPPFHLIKNEHFLPAFKEGIKQQEERINAIINNPEPANFENTIAALDYSGMLLNNVNAVFSNYNSALISDELQVIAKEVAPMLAAHADNITLNADLFRRVKTVYDLKDQLVLNEEQRMLLQRTWEGFVRNGAALPDDKKERFRQINEELSLLTLKFGQNVLGDVNSWKMFVENEADLAGLPQAVKDAAAEASAREGKQGQWLFTLHNPSVMPFLTYADNRELREKMGRAYINRGNNRNEFDNKQVINRIIELRIERSQMLGYDDFAAYNIEPRMARNAATVKSFLDRIWQAALPIARNEAAMLQQRLKAEGKNFKLAFWDWRYYAEKVRKEKYDLDESEIRQYFEINKVRDGIFMIAEKLWGLRFVQRTDVPVYHPDVTAWEVLEANGNHIGIFYMDMHPRSSKRSGAWMSNYRSQHIDEAGKFIHPVVVNVCNFTAPTSNQPSLLTFDEMETFFHEFGHALHGLLANTRYYSLSGTNTPTDFVELPSQIMENWASHPEVLKMFAKHYQTGEVIPEALIEKIMASSNFNQGFATVEFLASAHLDMEYHIMNSFEPFDVAAFEKGVMARYNMLDEIYFRHGSTHFQHIFTSDFYAAGYYSYIWAGVLDADAFEAFVETGDLFHQETARKFREEILSKGGTRDAMQMYVNFRGKQPGIEPLLKQRGLLR